MKLHSLSVGEWLRATTVGVCVALLTAAIMIAGLKSGISPLPKPLGLAFAERLLSHTLPLPIGLLFHTAWVTAFSIIYVSLFRDALTFSRALRLAAVLWAAVLAVFYPFVGWGFFGLAVTPKLIAASAVPHLLFALFLWSLCRRAFRPAAVRYPVSIGVIDLD